MLWPTCWKRQQPVALIAIGCFGDTARNWLSQRGGRGRSLCFRRAAGSLDIGISGPNGALAFAINAVSRLFDEWRRYCTYTIAEFFEFVFL